jgi:hypothetical protein
MTCAEPLCFLTAADAVVEPSAWGPHEWLSRAGLTAAEQLQARRFRELRMPAPETEASGRS